MSDQKALERQLDSFDPGERRDALNRLAALRLPPPKATENMNLHFHSFFSYNAEGWSPSHIAWESHRAGLYAAGLCDFDVLDGLEEFLQAGELLGLRATVNLETRVYVKEYADVDLSSPGEPGVTYIMGAGFVRDPAPGSPQAKGLAAFREGATARNIDLIKRINPHVPKIAIDYETDVLPLTPLKGATERHIIRAYVNKAKALFRTPNAVAGFWAGLLGQKPEEVQAILDTPKIEELIRAKLVKRGGLGYVQPSEDTFPPVDEFLRWVASCDAIPMVAWLDGTTGGEKDGRAMLRCMMDKGAMAMNAIPDRNWNIADPKTKAVKTANLKAIVEAADDLGLPLNIGTEMNRAGLPFVDDLSGAALRPFKRSFLRGARVMVGHSILSRYAGVSYATCECTAQEKNRFFGSVGALPPLTRPVAEKLAEMGKDKALGAIRDAAAKKRWQGV